MTQQSPCGPEPNQQPSVEALAGDIPAETPAQAEALYRLTLAILAESTAPDLPRLNQMILRRGRLLAALEGAHLENLPADRQTALQTRLEDCKKLDPAIELALKKHQAQLGEHLKELKSAHALLDKYNSAPQSEESGHRSHQA